MDHSDVRRSIAVVLGTLAAITLVRFARFRGRCCWLEW